MLRLMCDGVLTVPGKERQAFREGKGGNVEAVMRLIDFLAKEVMPLAVAADHEAHEEGRIPAEGFSGWFPAESAEEDQDQDDDGDILDDDFEDEDEEEAEPPPPPKPRPQAKRRPAPPQKPAKGKKPVKPMKPVINPAGEQPVPGMEDDSVQAYSQMIEAEDEEGVGHGAVPRTGFEG